MSLHTPAPHVLEALRTSCHTKIPDYPDTLDIVSNLGPEKYAGVKETLGILGARWNTRTKTHDIIRPGFAARMQTLLKTGAITDTRRALQQFDTPPSLATYVLTGADWEARDKVLLEPSAGEGALVMAARRHGYARVFAVELDPERVESLRAGGQAEKVVQADFLEIEPRPIYHNILMNPPFNRNQWLKHVLHACAFLAPGGVARAVVPPNAEPHAIHAAFPGFGCVASDCPGGLFEATKVAVRVLTIYRPLSGQTVDCFHMTFEDGGDEGVICRLLHITDGAPVRVAECGGMGYCMASTALSSYYRAKGMEDIPYGGVGVPAVASAMKAYGVARVLSYSSHNDYDGKNQNQYIVVHNPKE